jgi:predicted MFS family arabinose efflux permease
MQFGAIVGPLLAGVLLKWVDLSTLYLIDAITCCAPIWATFRLSPMPASGDGSARMGFRSVLDGFRYLAGNTVVLMSFVVDLIAMIFGMPRALFTFLIVEQFGRDPALVGLLFGAPAVGAFIGALASGWTASVRRQGRAVIGAVAAWGAAIAVFGLSGTNLWLGLLALALAGWADVISAIFRNTILQLATPDRLRGRLSAIHILVVTGGPRLGDLEAGLVARAVSPTFSVVSGGLACIAGAGLVAIAYPELQRYRSAPAPRA